MYGVNQYIAVTPSVRESEHYHNVGSEILIHPGHIEQHVNSFVVQLNVSHLPTEAEKKHIMDMLSLLKENDSIAQVKHFVRKIENELKKLHINLIGMRSSYFEIINTNLHSIYSILNKECTTIDRDNYIKTLVLYSDVLKELESFFDNSILKKPPLSLFYRNSKIYGDLVALEQLKQGKAAVLPNFMYKYKR